MKQASDLKRQLKDIDGKSYALYKELRGRYQFGQYVLALSLIHI